MIASNDARQMSDQQIDTIILAAFAAKQEVTVTLLNGRKVTGFVCSDFDKDGFSLTTSYVWWRNIRFVQPENKFYKEWADILGTASDPFEIGKEVE